MYKEEFTQKFSNNATLSLCLKEGEVVSLTPSEITTINEHISDIIEECIHSSDDLEDIQLDECLNEDDTKLTDEYEYEFCLKLIYSVDGVNTIYPGCHTLPNGDPGYPDECDSELNHDLDEINQYDKDLLIKSLKALPIIGDKIDLTSVSIRFSDATEED